MVSWRTTSPVDRSQARSDGQTFECKEATDVAEAALVPPSGVNRLWGVCTRHARRSPIPGSILTASSSHLPLPWHKALMALASGPRLANTLLLSYCRRSDGTDGSGF